MPIHTCKGDCHRHEMDVHEVVHERQFTDMRTGAKIRGHTHHTEWRKDGELVRRDVHIGAQVPSEEIHTHIQHAKSRTKSFGDVLPPKGE